MGDWVRGDHGLPGAVLCSRAFGQISVQEERSRFPVTVTRSCAPCRTAVQRARRAAGPLRHAQAAMPHASAGITLHKQRPQTPPPWCTWQLPRSRVPPFPQSGCLPRACKCSMPLAHCASIRLVILEAHLLLQTFKHRCLACNECICAV